MNTGFYDKAKHGIADAEILFDAGRYDASANRAYYACFHAAITVLKRFGIENTENPHASGTGAVFIRNYSPQESISP